MKMFELAKRAKNVLIKHWWYVFLLIVSTIYVIKYRAEIYQMTELNAQNLIFILWLVLLGIPLFAEIEIGNVKLKKTVEETRAEVKEAIGELKYQIMDMKISNSVTNNLNINNPSLPSKNELSELQKHADCDSPEQKVSSLDFGVSEDNVFLFQVRLSLEKQLVVLCKVFQYEDHRSIYAMIQFLLRHEVIDRNTADLIREIFNIATRGVHDEIVDDEYLQFVRKTYPGVKAMLDKKYDAYSEYNCYCVCPRCKYTGPSKYSNECPKCGFVSDDD